MYRAETVKSIDDKNFIAVELSLILYLHNNDQINVFIHVKHYLTIRC